MLPPPNKTMYYLAGRNGMPKKLEQKLKREAKKRGYGKKRTDAYVYGTLRKAGWKPKKSK